MCTYTQSQEKADPYLIQDASGARFKGLLTNGTANNTATSATTHATILPPSTSTNTNALNASFIASTSINHIQSQPISTHSTPTRIKPTTTTTTTTTTATGGTGTGAGIGRVSGRFSTTTNPLDPSYVRPPVASITIPATTPSLPTLIKLTTRIYKGLHGLGIDVSSDDTNNYTYIRQFKQMPEGILNPCLQAQPRLEIGDVIVAVNNIICTNFTHTVELLRSAPVQSTIIMTVERYS